ncbi:MAG: hypothetical protein Q9M43_13745 [Sulfurimonas sp.]|nr:hypothetical protein [Sulfurimonas sp.]
MKSILIISSLVFLFLGCSKEPVKPVVQTIFVEKVNNVYVSCTKEHIKVKIVDEVENGKRPQIKAKLLFKSLPKTYLMQSEFDALPNWNDESYDEALNNFLNSCKSKKTKKNVYKSL